MTVNRQRGQQRRGGCVTRKILTKEEERERRKHGEKEKGVEPLVVGMQGKGKTDGS